MSDRRYDERNKLAQEFEHLRNGIFQLLDDKICEVENLKGASAIWTSDLPNEAGLYAWIFPYNGGWSGGVVRVAEKPYQGNFGWPVEGNKQYDVEHGERPPLMRGLPKPLWMRLPDHPPKGEIEVFPQ